MRPLLRELGNATWRARVDWLRQRVHASNHSIACLCDTPGGTFNESLPSVEPFPARALIVPLRGAIAVDVQGPTGSAGGYTTHTLKPPLWRDRWSAAAAGDAGGGVPMSMTPRAAPVRVPFGRAHAVRTLGATDGGDGEASLWCYVFGSEPVGGGWPEPVQ